MKKNKVNQSKKGSADRLHIKRKIKRNKVNKKKNTRLNRITEKIILQNLINDYPKFLKSRQDLIDDNIVSDISLTKRECQRVRIIILPPKRLSLNDNEAETLEFLEMLNIFSTLKLENWYIALEICQHLHISVALVLTSRLKALMPKNPVIKDPSMWNESVFSVLYEFGCLEILNPNYKSENVPTRPFKYIKCTTSNLRDVKQHFSEYWHKIKLLPVKQREVIFNAFKEIANNVNDHAYPDEFDYEKNNLIKTKPTIWMIGAYNKNENTLYMGVYDSGIGIVNSIQTSDVKMNLLNKIKNINDSNSVSSLKTAFQMSSTGEVNRGSGLSEAVKNLVNEFDNIILNVYTNDVCGIMNSKEGDTIMAKDLPKNNKIQGTLSYFKISF